MPFLTGAMNTDAANKFISALVKALQTLCHGYVEFNDGIEIIGHIYLNIDSGSSFDYVVKEKLCKNAENSTVFVSKSFQAQPPPDEYSSRKDRGDNQAAAFEDSSMSPMSGTSRIQSALTSISNVLSGALEGQKPRLQDLSSHHSSVQNTGKRKREHNGSSYNSMQPPFKHTVLQPSSIPSSSIYFSSGPSLKQAADRNHSEHFNRAAHAEFLGGDSNQSSGMGPEDEEDLHLDVTFVKEEYESQRNSSHRGISANAASRLSQDLSSSQSNMLLDGTSGGGTLVYASSHHQLPQQFASGAAGDMGSLSQGYQDSLQVDVDQHTGQRPPNPRTSLALPDPASANCLSSPPSTTLSTSAHLQPPVLQGQRGSALVHTVRQTKWAVARARDDATAGPPVRMPEGVKPLCGYVHPEDVKKWMMYELLPGSGVYIHQENYNVVLSKTRQDRPDGKAMARYLMSCFWRQSELVGASIAEPPKPHQRSLDRGIIHAILGFCQHQSRELPTDIRRTMQQKIGYAKFYFVKKTQDPDFCKTTPASISLEASPRRMSMEMARRGAGGLPLNLPVKMPATGKRGRRTASETISRGLSEPDDLSRLSLRGTPELPSRSYSEIASDISSRLSDDSGRLATSSSSELLTDRLSTDVSSSRHSVGGIVRRMSADLTNRMSGDFSGHMPSDLPGRVSNDLSSRLPDDLSMRSASDLSTRPPDIPTNRMSVERVPGATLDGMPGRTSETSLNDLANRMGSMPAGMSRGFLDMLNNIYSSN